MLAKSHAALAALATAALTYTPILSHESLAVFLPIILVGALLPDIDEPRSFISQRLPVISRLVSLSFSHRGFTHFLIFPLLIVALAAALNPTHSAISAGLFALGFGVFLHQVGDMLTKSGIPHYFFPFFRVRAVLLPQFLRFRTGSVAEKCLFGGVFVPLLGLVGLDKLNISALDVEKILRLMASF